MFRKRTYALYRNTHQLKLIVYWQQDNDIEIVQTYISFSWLNTKILPVKLWTHRTPYLSVKRNFVVKYIPKSSHVLLNVKILVFSSKMPYHNTVLWCLRFQGKCIFWYTALWNKRILSIMKLFWYSQSGHLGIPLGI